MSAIIQLIRLCNICNKIGLRCLCYQKQMLIFFESVLFPRLYAIIFVWKRKSSYCLDNLNVWRCYHMVRSVTKKKKKQTKKQTTTTKTNKQTKKKKKKKKKKHKTHVSFYIWFSYTSYIVCISIVKCWSWSIYDDLGSTDCILTTNFDSRRYKPISLSLYDTVLLRTLHKNWSSVLQAAYGTVRCWRFVSKSKDCFGNSK